MMVTRVRIISDWIGWEDAGFMQGFANGVETLDRDDKTLDGNDRALMEMTEH